MERKKIFDILDIISNIIVVPVVILALFCGILMFNARNHNGVPSLFGYSAVTIITGSMNTEEHPEFAKGQTVLIKKCNPEDIQIDDVIAFYEYYETVDQEEGSESLSLTYSNSNVELEFQDFIGGTLNEASEDESRVIFHRVVDVREYTAEDGTVYKLFATKGDNNSYTDYFIEDGEQKTAWIREDFVIGKFYAKSGFITNVFNFCSSLLGLIVLVLVPCALILIMTTTSVVEQINSIRKDKNLEREQTIKTEKLYQGEVVGDEIVDADEHHEEENKEPKVEETKDEATEGTTEEKSKTNKTKGKKAKEETKSAGEEKPAEPVEEKQEQPHKKRGRKPKSEEKVDTSIVPDEPEEPKKPAEPVEEKPAEPVKETPIAPAKSSTSSKPAVPPKAPPKKAEGVPAKPSVSPKAPPKMPPKKDA